MGNHAENGFVFCLKRWWTLSDCLIKVFAVQTLDHHQNKKEKKKTKKKILGFNHKSTYILRNLFEISVGFAGSALSAQERKKERKKER
jgi:hypothetical protein